MPRPTVPSAHGADLDLDAAAPLPDAGAGGRPGPGSHRGAPSLRAVAPSLALALVASVTTGLVVHHRDAALARAEPPHLEVGYPEVRTLSAVVGTPRARIVLPVLNTGEDPVTVTAVALPAGAGPVEMAGPDVEVPPGERARVALEASPRCDGATTGAADVATLVVRTRAGEPHALSSELAAPFGRPALAAQLEGFCSATGLSRPVQMAVALLDDTALVLRATNTSPHPAQVALFAPRASGVGSDPPLPLELAAGQEVSIALTAAPECDTWSGGLPSMSVDVVTSDPDASERAAAQGRRDVSSGWSALLTSWVGGQVARACDPRIGAG